MVKNAPILLTNSKDDQVPELYAYIAENFNPDGQIVVEVNNNMAAKL